MQVDSHSQPEFRGDDTRLATERHVRHGDQPMAFQQHPRAGPHREGES